jgi:hypothetical protein
VIDPSVYPDVEHENEFEDGYDRADYVQRICAACDFGVPPDRDTVALFRDWRDVFDRFPIPDSPSYHALRAHFAGPPCRSSRASIPHRGKRWTHSKAGTIPARISSRPKPRETGSGIACSNTRSQRRPSTIPY